MCVCVVESKICPKISFFESKICPMFPHFFSCFAFFQNTLLSAGIVRFSNNKRKKTNTYHFEAKISPIMLRNMLGQILDSTLARFLTQPFSHFGPFSFSKKVETTIFIGFSAKILFCPPQKLGTIFVNRTALTELFFVPFFLHCCFWGVFSVSGFLVFFKA